MTTWIEGEHGNLASVERWGSEEAARKSLGSLGSRCSGCSRCSRCYDCYDLENAAPVSGGMPEIPVIVDIHKKVYAAANQPGAFDMRTWHTCDTTHCRAGWVIHLAGKGGYDLQLKTSAVFAAMQIYRSSGYEISPVRFFDTKKTALADMRRLAEYEPKEEK